MPDEELLRIVVGEQEALEIPRGAKVMDILVLAGIDAEEYLAADYNGNTVDLNYAAEESGTITPLGFDSPRGREAYRHTTSHIMAQAVKRLFPDAKLAIGPAIEDGFYYDFEIPEKLTPEDLPLIEEEMRRIISEDLPVERKEMTREEAIALFSSKSERFKVELLEEMDDELVTIYSQGEFSDLCRGPHLARTGRVRAFKLLSVAGAYWRGDESREMLQRIYGTAFDSAEELEKYLQAREEASRRDHRKLGVELELFSIRDEIGPGLVIYHPKGAVLRTVIEDFLKKEHAKRGYQLVISPHVMRRDIWATSGHLQMEYPMYFFDIEGHAYGIKPMNCPAHIMIYKSRTRGHRDLPLRFFELGTVYRHERSGVLHGLLRVRGFTQDDAHIFCTMEQAEEEINNCISFAFEVQRIFGFDIFRIALSTRPEHFVGTYEDWERATDTLKKALESNRLDYFIDEGEGVFYGPKIDVKLKDALGRWWQGPTIQFDFNLPRRFEMTYVGADNEEHTPVMIHRTVLGSLERYIGILIEQYAGAFPLWLAPVQVVVLPIADRHVSYAIEILEKLISSGIRAEINDERETTSNKIRKAWQMKIPYMIVVGDNEQSANTVSVRSLSGKDERGLDLENVINDLLDEIESKTIRKV